MPRLRHRKPKYCHHKPTNTARVTINGKTHSLGQYGSPESLERYEKLLSASDGPGVSQKSNGSGAILEPQTTSLGKVVEAYRQYATNQQHRPNYKNDKSTWTQALDKLEAWYSIPITDFGPKVFMNFRQLLVNEGRTRQNVNRHCSWVKQMIRWAVLNELAPGEVLYRLQVVKALAPGETKAKETKTVKAVPITTVQATLPHMPSVVQDMVKVQLLLGCRPGEVTGMTWGEIDTTSTPWVYRPTQHKLSYKGKARVITINKQAQKILKKYQGRKPGESIFQPEQHRKVHHYTKDTYRVAINRACVKAKVEKWSPNQLRHSAATIARQTLGLEAAQALLGHSQITTTQIYAEQQAELNKQVAEKLGASLNL